MQPTYKLLRTAGTAAVAVFLVAGAALATTSFVRTGRSADAEPAGNTTELTTSETTEVETSDVVSTPAATTTVFTSMSSTLHVLPLWRIARTFVWRTSSPSANAS